MKYTKSKSTKRFSFGIDRNTQSHKAGANTVTIGTRGVKNQPYTVSSSQITMTVKEAKSLQNFLNANLIDETIS